MAILTMTSWNSDKFDFVFGGDNLEIERYKEWLRKLVGENSCKEIVIETIRPKGKPLPKHPKLRFQPGDKFLIKKEQYSIIGMYRKPDAPNIWIHCLTSKEMLKNDPYFKPKKDCYRILNADYRITYETVDVCPYEYQHIEKTTQELLALRKLP